MAIDLEQFHQVFFEESFEGLDIMESSLMELDPSAIDNETINAVFRSAHSIKGGSATFGFTSISEFTHVLETLLDQVRAGERGVSNDDINLYLKSVDCMREMLELLRDGESGHTDKSEALKATFSAILAGDSASGLVSEASDEKNDAVNAEAAAAPNTPDAARPTANEAATGPKAEESTGWTIRFKPYPHIFLSGNDPYRNVLALSDLGIMSVSCDMALPESLDSFNAEHCYLGWEIFLESNCAREQVEEIFEWIEDDCDLTINAGDTRASDDDTQTNAQKLWLIEFEPGLEVLRSGNEPSRLIRALGDMGEILGVDVVTSRLPDLFSLNSESCYLAWNIRLLSDSVSEIDIRSVFEWVEDECKLTIVEGDPSEASPAASSQTVSSSMVEADRKTNASEIRALGASAQQVQALSDIRSKDLKSSDDASDKNTEPTNVAANKVNPNTQSNKQKVKPAAKKTATEATSIRVGIDKVDNLINMVGELVITQSMLGQLGTEFELDRVPKLMEGLSQLEQNTRELQESVMKIRMLPISFAFSRFPRMIRDLGQTLEKSVELKLKGENTELDKTVMEKIGDPLVHLVRNAVDHGIEKPDERVAAGKDPTGTITLNAFHQSGHVVIEIIDDGKGLDRDRILEKALEKNLISETEAAHLSDESVFDLIFQPGFSTAQTVSDVSGRGVGMDVVKRNIQALGGIVEINSTLGAGSKITIKLPLTLAILDGQLVRVGGHTYIFPLVSIIESMQCRQDHIKQVAGGYKVFKLRDEYVPIIELYKSFSITPDSKNLDGSLVVVVEADGEKVGIVVDELLAQQQVVIKSLEQNYKRVQGVSGATILGDGTVALILDILGVISLSSGQVGVSSQSLGRIIHLHESQSTGDSPDIQALQH